MADHSPDTGMLGTDLSRLSVLERDWLAREWELADDKSGAVLFERMANERNRLQDELDLLRAALENPNRLHVTARMLLDGLDSFAQPPEVPDAG